HRRRRRCLGTAAPRRRACPRTRARPRCRSRSRSPSPRRGPRRFRPASRRRWSRCRGGGRVRSRRSGRPDSRGRCRRRRGRSPSQASPSGRAAAGAWGGWDRSCNRSPRRPKRRTHHFRPCAPCYMAQLTCADSGDPGSTMVLVSKKSAPRYDRLLTPGRWVRDFVDDLAVASPARLAIGSFVAVVALFAILLMLPASMRHPGSVDEVTHIANSVFVAVSAVCVTGLSPVVTEEYWSDFGISVITAGIQVGGLGILTLASVLGMAVSRRLGVRQRLIAQQATSALNLGQVGSLLKTVVITIVTAEAILAVLLFPRFLIRGDSIGDATWYSVFYSISAFNNAGFTIHPGGGAHFASDPWILSLLMIGVFVGSLGFPVVL